MRWIKKERKKKRYEERRRREGERERVMGGVGGMGKEWRGGREEASMLIRKGNRKHLPINSTPAQPQPQPQQAQL
jgi:hypothetical protein